ncbi:hypothetical protein QR680_005482 [Steinernema hermaphroditum]|uniref:EB domain-containing protein n=1 Tax=Steinernema hermaphroditum TaxID=289476 RepID=A0AA39HUI6_9BILA|nr:hypothetical protein QR680_005482 [Steinernema hermaphroditum]
MLGLALRLTFSSSAAAVLGPVGFLEASCCNVQYPCHLQYNWPSATVCECSSNQVLLGGMCYPVMSAHQPCLISEQCAAPTLGCINGVCTPVPVLPIECIQSQVLYGGICYNVVPLGARCVVDVQCFPRGRCSPQKRCEPLTPATCRNPGELLEVRQGRVVDCSREWCSPHFYCDHEARVCCAPPELVPGAPQVPTNSSSSRIALCSQMVQVSVLLTLFLIIECRLFDKSLP